jgi:Zn-dependent peptidase ImmA (M78 family)
MVEDDEIERAARRLRTALGIDDQLRPDLPTVIYKLKDRGLIKNYERVPDSEMPDDEAKYDSVERVLYVRESTFCAADAMFLYSESERRRARYTIAHEVGHIALGHDGVRFRGESAAKMEKIVPKIRRQEYEANRFAAAFLAPAHLALER